MTLLDRIIEASNDTATLDKFLSNNALEVIDWFNKIPYGEILRLSSRIRDFVLLKAKVWSALPRSANNLAFLTLMLEKTEQLSDVGSFGRIHAELSKTHFDIGSRLSAAALYLNNNLTNSNEFLSCFDEIYSLLLEASHNEDDSPDKSLSTIIHYYLVSIESFGEFNSLIPRTVHELLNNKIITEVDSFLRCQLMFDVLSVSLNDSAKAAEHVRELLDEYLNRKESILGARTGLLIEEGTRYCDLLSPVDKDFTEIRALSVTEHMANPQRNEVYYSLNRGTAIIDSEEQLYAYMHAFGEMHSEKLLCAFQAVPFDNIQNSATVVDWGCGQGTAIMMLFDYLIKENIALEIAQVVLVEPSELALKRGGRHSTKFDNSTALATINKTLDELGPADFNVKEGLTIHLFSNILDVSAVSLNALSTLIQDTFQGTNLFICVSPYIDDTKKQRLDTFMNSFDSHSLEVLCEINEKKGQWKKGWTRLTRVFTAEL